MSVRLSVKRVDCDKAKKDLSRFLYRTKKHFSRVFWEEEWFVGGGDTFYLNFWFNRPRWSQIADFQSIFARSASAVASSKKVQLTTNRNSTTRFPTSLRWTLYVAPKPLWGAQKFKTAVFRVKVHLAERKSAAKFLCMTTLTGTLKSPEWKTREWKSRHQMQWCTLREYGKLRF